MEKSKAPKLKKQSANKIAKEKDKEILNTESVQIDNTAPPPPPPPPPLPEVTTNNKDNAGQKEKQTNIFRIKVASWGYEDARRLGSISVNGQLLADYGDRQKKFRGIHIVTYIKQQGSSAYSFDQYNMFDVWKHESNAESMNQYIQSLPKGTLVIGGTADEVFKNLKHAIPALTILHLDITDFSYRGAIAFVTRIGHNVIYKEASKRNTGPVTLKKVISLESEEETLSAGHHVTAGMLQKQMKKLKASKKIVPTFVDKKKLFLDGDSESFFPLSKIRTMFEVPFEQAVAHLDFTGIDQLTDLFFFMLLHQQRLVTVLNHINHISIRGCYYVTDQGIKWLSEACPSLISIASHGCKFITEKSISYLVNNCKNIETISLIGSSIGNVYIPKECDMGALKLKGCPLVTSNAFHSTVMDQTSVVFRNIYFEELREQSSLNLYKVVVIKSTNPESPNILSLLSPEGADKDSQGLFNQMKVKLPKKDTTFNIIECTQEISDIYFSERTIYIIPYNTNDPLHESKYDIVSRITHVLAQIPTACFIVIPLMSKSNSDTKTVEMLTREQVCQSLHKKVKHYVKLSGRQTLRLVDVESKNLEFMEQETTARGITLSFALLDVIEDHQRIIFMDENQEDWKTSFCNSLEDSTVAIDYNHPWCQGFSKEFKDLVNQYNFSEKVMYENEFAKKLQEMDEQRVSDQLYSYVKVIEYLHMLGIVVHVCPKPSNSGIECEGLVVTDPQWLNQILNKILTKGNATHQIWKKKELKSLLEDVISADQEKKWNDFLTYGSFWMNINEDTGVFTPQIAEQPHVDKSHYFGDYFNKQPDKQDLFDILKCEFKLLQPLPTSFFIKLAGNPAMSYEVVWRYGLICVDLPVESLIFWENVETSSYLATVSVVCQKPKQQTGTEDMSMLWNKMDKFTTLLHAMFKEYGIAYTYQNSHKGEEVKKPDHIHGVVSKCDFSGKSQKCKFCESTFKQSQLFWEMKHFLKPAFLSEKPAKEILEKTTSKNVILKGNWVSTNKKEQLVFGFKLFPEDNNSIEVSLRTGDFTEFVISGSKDALIVNTKKCVIEHCIIGVTEAENTTKAICPLQCNFGDSLEICLYKDKDMVNHAKVKKNCMFICDIILLDGSGYQPFIHTSEMCGVHLRLINNEHSSVKPAVLMPGMRLEAFDKISADRICVATIGKIDEDTDKILIHFDGWTSRYDYWTVMSDPYIHPAGYFYQRDMNSATYKKHRVMNHLQPPKQQLALTGRFKWDTYISEIKAWPVPYELFTEEQTGGCSPFEMSSETLKKLMTESTIMFNALCRTQQAIRAQKFNKVMETFLEKGKKSYDDSVVNSSKYVPVICVLPNQLTKDKVLYPSMQSMMCNSKEESYNVHVLCPSHYNHHFIDDGTSEEKGKLKKTGKLRKTSANDNRKLTISSTDLKTITKYMIAVLSQLLEQQNLFPEKVFPGLATLSPDKLQTGIKELLKYQLFTYCISNEGKNQSSTIPDEEISFVKKIVDAKDDQDYNDMLCSAHYTALNFHKMGQHQLDLNAFGGYANLISKLFLGMTDSEEISEEIPKLTELPAEFFPYFPHLTHLVLKGHKIKQLPKGLGYCTKLEVLDVSDNPISELQDIELLKETLIALDISRTNCVNIPENVYTCAKLRELRADKIKLMLLLPAIGELKHLQILSLAENCLSQLPDELANCENLVELNLSGIKWSHRNLLSYENFTELMNEHPLTMQIDEKRKRQMFHDIGQNVMLNESEVGKLNLFLFMEFPRLRAKDELNWQFLNSILNLQQLEVLNLSYQGLKVVPPEFQKLTSLVTLNVSHNPLLESVAAELSVLKTLKAFELRGCPSLKTPPREIVNKGFQAITGYLRRLMTGSVECKRTKLMIVGLGGAGKTSLVSRFVKGRSYSYFDYDYDFQDEDITDGIDIVDWTIQTEQGALTYSIWDFAGQSVYYNTHQFFLSNRAVYLLLWNIRLGYEHAGLDFWLSSIACHAPKAPVVVVGTHRDQVDKFWLPEEEIRRKYPQIRSFHAISVFKNIGVKELVSDLTNITLQEKYMGEKIPEAWLNFEKKMTKKKTEGSSLLMWSEVEELAVHAGLVDKTEMHQAVGFLHDLGSVQHFRTMFLRSRVVINPQWIVDAMACVVSVHDTPIVDGYFAHRDVRVVWKSYPEELHSWLRRLTEEFDLTFPLPDKQANIVPCLLPPEPPEYKWPNAEDIAGFKETKMLYKFGYLPAGLFNRAQVRLYQFCDSSVIWKKGSKLMKNGHHALMQQINDKEVLVKAQGYRPENVIFLVHEVFESLIAESFHGVTYDYFVPCADCMKVDFYDPCMFPASKVRRATELKAPFLQCDKYFHTLSLEELHASMPPSSNADFDVHLERSVRDLEDIQSDLVSDIFMVYCREDIPSIGEESKRIHPRKICDDLENNGFKVWFPMDPEYINLQLVSVTMKDAKVVVICISDHFVANKNMCDIFHYAKTNLQKTIQLVVLGSSLNWKNSTTGLLATDDVFVNMMQPDRYPHKIKELIDKLKAGTSISKEPVDTSSKCFISYCWSNSAEAVKKGSKKLPGALGWGDPRDFKRLLENNGVSCWMDIEKTGQGGLFEDIADGLKNAKVMVACVSDEYAKSRNCQIEFRFACLTLKIPMVIAVVGTGLKWESTEVGMLSLGSPKIMFQYNTATSNERLIEAVKKVLPQDEQGEDLESRTPSVSDNNQAAFQELLELAQRKFLRQVAQIAEGKGGFPRLFVLDFMTDQEKDEYSKEKSIIDDTKHDNSKTVNGKTESETNKEDEKQSTEAQKNNELGSQVSLRPKSGIRKRTSALTAAVAVAALTNIKKEELADEEIVYCARFLCEHEQGWHCHGKSLPLSIKHSELEDLFDIMAPYMVRLLAILKYAAIDLQIINSTKGEHLRKQLEEKCGTESEFSKEYKQMREFMKKLDEQRDMGGLTRCQLPSGKVVWLCPDHVKIDDRITILGVEDNLDTVIDPDEDTITASMLEEINKTEDLQQNTPSSSDTTTANKKSVIKSRSSQILKDGSLKAKVKIVSEVAGGLNGSTKSKACLLM